MAIKEGERWRRSFENITKTKKPLSFKTQGQRLLVLGPLVLIPLTMETQMKFGKVKEEEWGHIVRLPTFHENIRP